MTTANDVGPIARKIIAAGHKQQRQQIVDLSTVRRAPRVGSASNSILRRSRWTLQA